MLSDVYLIAILIGRINFFLAVPYKEVRGDPDDKEISIT